MVTLYFYDNIIQYKEREEIKEYILPSNAMDYGKIKNIPIFENCFKKLALQEKWLGIFQKKNITVILPNHYNEMDKEVIDAVFYNIGLKVVKYMKENKLYNLKNNQVILNIHQKYLTYISKQKNKIIVEVYPFYIFNNLNSTLNFILKNKPSKNRYFCIGNNHNIPHIVDMKNVSNLLYYRDYSEHLIKKTP